MTDFVQLLVQGVALGAVYGLVALGFVVIYKATEVINFAHGELLLLGAYVV
ncbi:MAG: branched-chain amino acid ABC transporter permease, partial [Chloroflexota bacterium]